MTENPSTQPLNRSERLARFVLFSGWIRKSDQTVRPDAFIPYPYPDLSVTRHLSLSAQEVWAIGEAVAKSRPAKLYGRADIFVADALDHELEIRPHPVPDNPNHANVISWPMDKPSQKIIALELAAAATFSSHSAQDSQLGVRR
jgi:hypothetical protein